MHSLFLNSLLQYGSKICDGKKFELEATNIRINELNLFKLRTLRNRLPTSMGPWILGSETLSYSA